MNIHSLANCLLSSSVWDEDEILWRIYMNANCIHPYGISLNKVPLSLLLALSAIILMAWSGFADRFQWDRSHPWDVIRWFGCHWTHWSWSHVLWDAVVFAALGAWAQRLSPRGFGGTLVLASLAIPLSVQTVLPGIAHYRGLSGLDSALFGFIATRLGLEAYRKQQRKDLLIIGGFFLAFVGKTLFEMLTARSVFVGTADLMVPVTLAHAIGAGIGMGVAALKFTRSSKH